MKVKLLALTLCLSVSGIAQAQIGTLIPDNRLPLETASPRVTVWQDAGYFPHLGGNPIVYTLLVDVTDLGAAGNGTTDDTAAFQSAISQAAAESALGGFTVVYAPAGTYRLTSGLSLSSNMVLKGAGSTQTALNIQIPTGNYISIANKENTGVEDLKISTNTANDIAGHSGYFFSITNLTDGYIRGCETATSPRSHVKISGSTNVEIRDNYFHDAVGYGGGGEGYGIDMDLDTVKCLIENNVFRHLRHSMVLQNDCHHNVFAYNASHDPWREEVPHDWAADIALHGHWDANRSGPYENLFEGNMVQFIGVDDSHDANGNLNLFFRNKSQYLGLYIANTTNNQNMVNNWLECDTWGWTVVGHPWWVGGSGHYAQNNECRKKKIFGGYKTFWEVNRNTAFDAEVSYVYTAKPGFMGAKPWPYRPASDTNPAYDRGNSTVTAGWSGYQAAP